MFRVQNYTTSSFSDAVIDWWRLNGRKFPWRKSEDPYIILIAEVMLHRTKASQVESVFTDFIGEYPDLESLFNAEFSEINDIMRPLGLNWRIGSVIELVNKLKRTYGGSIPEDREELMSLPGIGDYTASAIRCFAFGYPEIVVDTNTSRVISRLFALNEKGEIRRKKAIRDAYGSILDRSRSREFNYALLDLGSTICTSRNMRCGRCPVFDHCATARNGVIV